MSLRITRASSGSADAEAVGRNEDQMQMEQIMRGQQSNPGAKPVSAQELMAVHKSMGEGGMMEAQTQATVAKPIDITKESKNKVDEILKRARKISGAYDNLHDVIQKEAKEETPEDKKKKEKEEKKEKDKKKEDKKIDKKAMWKGKLQEQYESLEEFQSYSEMYGLAERLGFESAEEAWEANPEVQGSVDPAEYGIAEEVSPDKEVDEEYEDIMAMKANQKKKEEKMAEESKKSRIALRYKPDKDPRADEDKRTKDELRDESKKDRPMRNVDATKTAINLRLKINKLTRMAEKTDDEKALRRIALLRARARTAYARAGNLTEDIKNVQYKVETDIGKADDQKRMKPDTSKVIMDKLPWKTSSTRMAQYGIPGKPDKNIIPESPAVPGIPKAPGEIPKDIKPGIEPIKEDDMTIPRGKLPQKDKKPQGDELGKAIKELKKIDEDLKDQIERLEGDLGGLEGKEVKKDEGKDKKDDKKKEDKKDKKDVKDKDKDEDEEPSTEDKMKGDEDKKKDEDKEPSFIARLKTKRAAKKVQAGDLSRLQDAIRILKNLLPAESRISEADLDELEMEISGNLVEPREAARKIADRYKLNVKRASIKFTAEFHQKPGKLDSYWDIKDGDGKTVITASGRAVFGKEILMKVEEDGLKAKFATYWDLFKSKTYADNVINRIKSDGVRKIAKLMGVKPNMTIEARKTEVKAQVPKTKEEPLKKKFTSMKDYYSKAYGDPGYAGKLVKQYAKPNTHKTADKKEIDAINTMMEAENRKLKAELEKARKENDTIGKKAEDIKKEKEKVESDATMRAKADYCLKGVDKLIDKGVFKESQKDSVIDNFMAMDELGVRATFDALSKANMGAVLPSDDTTSTKKFAMKGGLKKPLVNFNVPLSRVEKLSGIWKTPNLPERK